MHATLGVYMGIGGATLTLWKIKHQKMSSLTHKHKDGGEGGSVKLLHMSSRAFFRMCYNENSFWVAFVWLLLLFLICPFMTL